MSKSATAMLAISLLVELRMCCTLHTMWITKTLPMAATTMITTEKNVTPMMRLSMEVSFGAAWLSSAPAVKRTSIKQWADVIVVPKNEAERVPVLADTNASPMSLWKDSSVIVRIVSSGRRKNNAFLGCGHLDFQSAVVAQNDEFRAFS